MQHEMKLNTAKLIGAYLSQFDTLNADKKLNTLDINIDLGTSIESSSPLLEIIV